MKEAAEVTLINRQGKDLTMKKKRTAISLSHILQESYSELIVIIIKKWSVPYKH